MEQCEIRIENGLPVGKTHPSLMQSILLATDFDVNKTLDLYGVTLLDEFIDAGIQNPTMDNILSFIEQDNINESGELNTRDRQTMLDVSLQSSYIEDVKERFIEAFNVEGVFGINTDKLKESGLFSDSDILYLVDTDNLKNVQDLYYKLNRTDEVFESINSEVIIETGGMTRLNPDKFEQNIQDYYIGLTTPQEVLEMANQVGDEIITENPSLINNVMRAIKGKQSLVKYETDEYTGQVLPKAINNQLARIEQTLDMNQDFAPLVGQVEYIKAEPLSLYVENLPMVYAYLRNIENQATDLGLDLNGFADTMLNKRHEDTIDFLDSFYNFLTDIMTFNEDSFEESMNDYVNAYNSYFEISPEVKRMAVDEITNDGIYLHLETNRSEEELFLSNSVIKVGENTYQRIEDSQDLGYLYDLLFDNSTLLPKSIYSAQVKNTNKDLILDDIDQYISGLSQDYLTENSDPEAVKRMVAYKILFNVEDVTPSETITGEINIKPETFLLKFNKLVLKDDLLRDIFYFSNRGLEAKQVIGDYTVKQLQNTLSENNFNDLVQYAKLSGNQSLEALRNLDTEYATTPYNLRDYYANNMHILPAFKNDHYKKDGYVVADSTKDFIKIQNELYEQVAPNVYGKIERDSRYVNSNLDKPSYNGSIEPEINKQQQGRIKIKKNNKINDNTIEFC